jgi:hypothetical protein
MRKFTLLEMGQCAMLVSQPAAAQGCEPNRFTTPIDRTMSTFLVLPTPVMSAPNQLAIRTAIVHTSRGAVDQDVLGR